MPNRSEAVAARCVDCIYDPLAPGGWRDQVAACPVRTCPLWPIRPAGDPRVDLVEPYAPIRLQPLLRRIRGTARKPAPRASASS